MAIHEVGPNPAHQHLAEMLELLRADLREFREEMRESLSDRVTYTELAAFHQLFNTKLENLAIQAGQREENLKGRIGSLNQRVKELEDKLSQEQEKNGALQRHFLWTAVGGAGALIGTNVFQGLM